jgi:hypothetical protein
MLLASQLSLATTRMPMDLKTGALDVSATGGAKTKDIAIAQGLRVACSLLFYSLQLQ